MLVQQLLTHYPRISKLRELGFSYAEIVESLEKNNNVVINSKNKVNYLTAFISRVQAKKINQSYKKYSLISHSSFIDLTSSGNALKQEFVAIGSLFCTLTSLVKPSFLLIDKSNIHEIKSYQDAIIAKRLLLLHEISDSDLFNLISSKTNTRPSIEDIGFAQTIHLKIDEIINSAVTRLKQQLAESI